MSYGYYADLDMDYMSEDELIDEVVNILPYEDYVEGIEAIERLERKALIQDLVANWHTINNRTKLGYDVMQNIIEQHGITDMTEFDLILETIDELFKI